jgi:transcriptional regulator with XRE-family HTH domain
MKMISFWGMPATPSHGPPSGKLPDASHAARLGAEIRTRRQAQGLTLKALATLIGFSPQHLSEVELAKTPVSGRFIAACDQALGARGTLVAQLPAVVCERALQRHDCGTAPRRMAGEATIVHPATWRSSGDNLGVPRGHMTPPSALIREARQARGWSLVEAARALISSSPQPLPDVDSVVRSWKRWEHKTTPSSSYRPLLANLLGIEIAALAARNPRRRKTSATERSVVDPVPAPQSLASMTLALTLFTSEDPAQAAGRRVGMADVGTTADEIAHLRRLDNQYGSGHVRERVMQLLHREANIVMHGSYSEQTGKALLSAVAQVSWGAGVIAADVGRHALAQRYYLQALNLATGAGDQLYAASVLAHTSRLTAQIGHRAVTKRNRVRYGREAIVQARAGHSVANGTATPVLSALLCAVEARGHALLGDAGATRTSVLGAQRHYERARWNGEPTWLSFYTEAELAADLGRCLRDVGELEQATRLMTRALDGYESWRVRSRCFVQTDLAGAQLSCREFEHAEALGHEAVRAAASVRSARALDGLRVLQRQIRPVRVSSLHLGELDDRITDLLTRSHPNSS